MHILIPITVEVIFQLLHQWEYLLCYGIFLNVSLMPDCQCLILLHIRMAGYHLKIINCDKIFCYSHHV